MKNCKWCGDTVKNSNADECDRCWELRWQCEVVPELVAKILSASNNSVQPTIATAALEDSPFETGMRRNAVVLSNRNSG